MMDYPYFDTFEDTLGWRKCRLCKKCFRLPERAYTSFVVYNALTFRKRSCAIAFVDSVLRFSVVSIIERRASSPLIYF